MKIYLFLTSLVDFNTYISSFSKVSKIILI